MTLWASVSEASARSSPRSCSWTQNKMEMFLFLELAILLGIRVPLRRIGELIGLCLVDFVCR